MFKRILDERLQISGCFEREKKLYVWNISGLNFWIFLEDVCMIFGRFVEDFLEMTVWCFEDFCVIFWRCWGDFWIYLEDACVIFERFLVDFWKILVEFRRSFWNQNVFKLVLIFHVFSGCLWKAVLERFWECLRWLFCAKTMIKRKWDDLWKCLFI